MDRVKALLIGVCRYSGEEYPFLPYFANDVEAVRTAAAQGLGARTEDLLVCGSEGRVTAGDLENSLHQLAEEAAGREVFLLYFSGLWFRNYLLLSDRRLPLEELVRMLERIRIRRKILVFDCSHFGNFSENRITRGDLHRNVDYLAEQGYTVLTSVGAPASSGINRDREISIYTVFIEHALRNPYLIRNGEKNIYDLHKAVYYSVRYWNRIHPEETQQVVLRTYQPETVSVRVRPGSPGELTAVYAETESYLIYDVQKIAHRDSRRFAVRVILRYCFLPEDLAGIAEEIMERLHAEKPDVIWIYFGRSEEDMKKSRYLCQTTWADASQNTEWWYRKTEQSLWIQGVYFTINPSYSQCGGFLMPEQTGQSLSAARKERDVLTDRFLQAVQSYLSGTEASDGLNGGEPVRSRRTAASRRGETERICQRIYKIGAEARDGNLSEESRMQEEQKRALADSVLDLILLEKSEPDSRLFSEENRAAMKRQAQERAKKRMEEYMS